MLLRYYVAADLWFCEVSETNGSYVLAFHLSQACSRPHRSLQYDEGPLVRARNDCAVPELEEYYEYHHQATAAKNKESIKPAVESKRLVRGSRSNDEEDWAAARLQGTAGGRGGK